ncbi:MAG: 4Fe4S-binding leucine-rich repeat protein [Burkholderiaceae bacterium]|nr:4Fe4S-binding leucine-rich repeat protein [Burkholderiaceae bacterium]
MDTPVTNTAAAAWNDIPVTDWQGVALDCSTCRHQPLQRTGGCEPGRSCMQDAYARRIDRFFRTHPALAGEHLDHAYFEVRAIAARHADVFLLPRLMDDPDETVRLQLALRLPQRLLSRLRSDPHREVRKTVAHRVAPALLPLLMNDPDLQVRLAVAQRVAMPALWRMVEDPAPEVRRVVAERLPVPLLDTLAGDDDWLVRWTTAGRALGAALQRLLGDHEAEVRERAAERIAELNLDRIAGLSGRHVDPSPGHPPAPDHG